MDLTRRKEELDTMTTGDLSALIQDQIADEIDTAVREKRVGRDLLAVNDALVGSPGNTMKFIKRGTISGHPTGESQDSQYDKLNGDGTYQTEITVSAEKFSAGSEISREAITDGREDLVDATEEEIGQALADIEDIICLGVLAGGSFNYQEEADSTDGSDNLVTASTPIFEVVDVQDVGDDGSASAPISEDFTVVDYDNGAIDLPDTSTPTASNYDVTYVDLADASVTDADSMGTIDPVKDVLNGIRRKIASRKYNPDTIVVNDANLAEIMSADNFVDASKYGDNDVVMNGEVGRMFGMRVLVSSQIPDKWVVGADVEAEPAVLVLKEDVRTLQKEAVTSDDLKIVAYQRYGAGIKKADAVEVLKVTND
jgi:N4-gp56 family major capsid protein